MQRRTGWLHYSWNSRTNTNKIQIQIQLHYFESNRGDPLENGAFDVHGQCIDQELMCSGALTNTNRGMDIDFWKLSFLHLICTLTLRD